MTTLPHLRNLAIVGPTEVSGVSDNATRKKIFVCRPVAANEDVACARRIIANVATEAYRRPATTADIDELMPFYRDGAKTGGFEAGIRNAMQATLASLHFIFRVEETPTAAVPGAPYKISDIDLASRLSFFLWGTSPDRTLIDLAKRAQLSQPVVFEAQVKRMLADPKAEALGTRFAAQWLRLQDLDKVEPDALSYPYFDDTLAEAMERETELLLRSIVREDRSVLICSPPTTRSSTSGSRVTTASRGQRDEFRRVQYPDDTRRGLLGHGSILTLTSRGNRTSPVLRGKWVMEVLLGSPPPPPPPNVPLLEETGDADAGKFLSVAEQIAKHRATPLCSSCHNVIDPIGLALDNFDVTGSWRIKDSGVLVDAAGELYDGTHVDGVADLRARWSRAATTSSLISPRSC